MTDAAIRAASGFAAVRGLDRAPPTPLCGAMQFRDPFVPSSTP